MTTSFFVIPESFSRESTEEDVFPSSVVFCIFCFPFSFLILRLRLSVFSPSVVFYFFIFFVFSGVMRGQRPLIVLFRHA